MSDALAEQLALLPEYLGRHLLLSLTALAAGITISALLTYVAIRRSGTQAPMLAIAGALQTIPGLALLALMVPLLSRIGFVPAVVALTLYSVLPVLRNAVTGIQNVDASLIEAGRGLGMTDNQLLVRLQLPLALPVIVAGVRTAAVWVVGMATLSTPVGATSLGNYIFSGLQTQNYTAVVLGCAAAATLALALDRLIRALETGLLRRDTKAVVTMATMTGVLLFAGLAPLVFSDADTRGRASIVIGAKTFTEQYILAELIANELQSAGLSARTLPGLGSTVAFDALAAGRIDAYVDYTGTIWANYMGRTDNPGRAAMLDGVTRWLREEHGIEVAASPGFENAYAIAVSATTAQARNLRSIADLSTIAPDLRFGSDYEFLGRPEWRALADSYQLEFADLVSMDSTLMYAAVASGEVDVITAFSTDGRIAAFDLQLLDDPRDALPAYDAVLLTRAGLREDQPAAFTTLSALHERIDIDAMRTANRAVDLDGSSITEAARMLATEIR